MDDIAIKVSDVSKNFKLPHEKHGSLKSTVINFNRSKKGYDIQEAVNDASFEVKKGEFFGIVGRNGSGKSTLLKLLAGIYVPTEGLVQVNGTLTPFIELGVGFNPELTGRENVFLNGALLGFNRKEMQAMYKDIVEFAELKNFMDQKLKNYSSGMQVRLAFSIAIRAKSDILLIDEVLAVGDAAFQQKCFNYFDKLKEEAKTIVFVTHDMESFEKYCDRGILVDAGKIVHQGDPLQLSAEYKMLNIRSEAGQPRDSSLTFDGSVQGLTVNTKENTVINHSDSLDIKIDILPKRNIDEAIVGLSILRSDGIFVAFHNTNKSLKKFNLKKNKPYKFTYKLNPNDLLPGAYSLDAALYDSEGLYVDLKTVAGKFVITGNDDTRAGVVKLEGKWSLGE